ncbi:phosphotriesterase family protein [Pararhizobium sp.]|uniref:phosphotriesterase family protein n=1 Tax=Pararhizobium sp. TaxID=1977563 RepID=UPI00271CB228|nr:phosphotriesterase-related protein [Pararhizobium sp.]MDO9415495.1 phosphotriesterase-related protein [Pararhizobium sp.]
MSYVLTVLGPVSPDSLGPTITHEHLFIDLSCYLRPPSTPEPDDIYYQKVDIKNLYALRRDAYSNRDNCILDDVELACREVELFKAQGGRTIVDVTLVDIGRDVKSLAEVARRTGINIVAGCGHYIFSAFPKGLAERTEDEIYQEIISEIRDGIDGTGIRPGIIGEIGSGDPIHEQEKKVLRAAARAQKESGLAISIHVHAPGRRGNEVLDILIGAGVNPEKIILGHIDASLAHLDIDFNQAMDYILSLAERGCFIEFDLCGNSGHFVTKDHTYWMPSDRERAKALALMCKKNHAHQILLSQDVGHKHYLQEYGGWGYSHVFTEFHACMLEAGIDEETISRFFTVNPTRALTVQT